MLKDANKRLIQVRGALGLKQKELAKQLSMLPSSYNQIETGRNNVSPRVVALLRLIHSVNDKWLIKGEGNMFLPKKPHFDDIEDMQEKIVALEQELERYKKVIDALIGKK